jgi:hypothetical protein
MPVDRWVNERISRLKPNDEWQPNVMTGLARLREREARAVQKRSWVLLGVATATACLGVIALPASRATVRRLWNDMFFQKTDVVRQARTAKTFTEEASAEAAHKEPQQREEATTGPGSSGIEARGRIENITSDIVANAIDTTPALDGGVVVFWELGRQGPAMPIEIAPPPYDPFELVTSRPTVVKTSEARSAAINLLGQALDKRAFYEPDLLPPQFTPVGPGVPYSVKVSFTAGGHAQDVGPGEMEETRNADGARRWTGRVGSFSLTRIISDLSYDVGSRRPIPMRLEMVREIVFGNLGGTPPNYTADSIRTATARLDGALLTCILISTKSSEAPIRDWSEREYCIDSQSEMLRVYSAAPGIYVVFHYSNSSDFHGHVVPDQFTVTEAGKVILEGAVSVKDPDTQSLDPALFTPTRQMSTGEADVTWPIHHIQPRVTPISSSLLEPIVVHATLSPDGSVIEAEALQTSDPRLSRSAIDLVRETKYDSGVEYGYPRQQEIFVTVQ